MFLSPISKVLSIMCSVGEESENQKIYFLHFLRCQKFPIGVMIQHQQKTTMLWYNQKIDSYQVQYWKNSSQHKGKAKKF